MTGQVKKNAFRHKNLKAFFFVRFLFVRFHPEAVAPAFRCGFRSDFLIPVQHSLPAILYSPVLVDQILLVTAISSSVVLSRMSPIRTNSSEESVSIPSSTHSVQTPTIPAV